MARQRALTVCGVVLLLSCGGTTDPGNTFVIAKASPSGDGQSGQVGAVLALPLRAIVTQAGAPVAGRTVTWSLSGGFVNPASSTTGADGIASTSVTLPGFAANNTVTAVTASASGSPLRFTVVSTGATSAVTIQVVNDDFLPSNAQVKVGGTVTFAWQSGAVEHNVTPVAPNTIPVSSNPAPPGVHDAPYTFETTFPAIGTFAFFCGQHGTPSSGMRGAITVVP